MDTGISRPTKFAIDTSDSNRKSEITRIADTGKASCLSIMKALGKEAIRLGYNQDGKNPEEQLIVANALALICLREDGLEDDKYWNSRNLQHQYFQKFIDLELLQESKE